MIVYQEVSTRKPQVALTFDDGPNPYATSQILDILESRQIRGTFFTIGCWAELWPEMLRRVAEKHVIGNHSYLHENPAIDFSHAEAVIHKVIGRSTAFARIPFHGEPSAELSDWIGDRRCVNGYVTSDDWRPDRTADSIFHNVISHPRLGNGAVIIFHDGSESIAQLRTRPLATIEALPRIIEALHARGLECVGLDTLFQSAEAPENGTS